MLWIRLFDSLMQLTTIVIWIWAVNQAIAIPRYLVGALNAADVGNELEEFIGKLL